MNKKVLVFGLGLNQGGVGSAKFFAKHGDDVRVTDLKNAEILKPSLDQLKDFKINYTLGEHQNKDIDWADLIIKNPGVKPGNPYIEYALQQGKQVEQDMGIFLEHVKSSQIIGITGTKGKSTTSSLIYEILKSSEKKVILAGNIGTSVLDSLDQIDKDTLVVLELSSFQLEAFEKHQVSPHWAIITNIYEDHLNYYKNMDEYTDAKKIIARYQTPDDFLFLRKNDPATTEPEFLSNLRAKISYFSKDDLPEGFTSILKGEHNRENMAAALKLTSMFGIDEQIILHTLSNFKGVPFRMELIKTWHGIKIYNDTTATGPDACIQAIKTFPDCILIAGGMNKGMHYKNLAETIDQNVKAVYFLEGDVIDDIICNMQDQSIIEGRFNNLGELLKKLKTDLRTGDVVVFSPGATSFNMFQNEFDRGRKFNAAVEKIFRD